MTFAEYSDFHQQLLTIAADQQQPPYTSALYLDYTRMNFQRSRRWLKTLELEPKLLELLQRIQEPQLWLLITEPWCGDAAHSVPVIQRIAEVQPLIRLEIQLRDQEPYTINKYLTRGGKSIPKLIMRSETGKDQAVWGPRPLECQLLYDQLTAAEADFETIKMQLQHWYNTDKGRSIQEELLGLLKKFVQPAEVAELPDC